MISKSLSKTIKIRALIFTNEIILKINGTGNQTIISNEALIPSQIYINNDTNPFDGDKMVYNLENDLNTISLIYNSKLTSCKEMFLDLKNIIEINLTNFDFSEVTDMSDMFHKCNSLQSIDFSNINTSSLTNMNFIFYECSSLENLDLSSFDTKSVTSMIQTFINCYSLKNLDISSFNTTLVTSMSQMFLNCHALKSLDLSNFNTPSLTSMKQMFLNCISLENLNLLNFDTKSVTNMEQLFFRCHSLKSLDLNNFDISSLTEMSHMFYECKTLKSLNLSSFNTSNIYNMAEMFTDCNNLEIIDISSFDTSNVENMGNMFKGCSSLVSLNLSNFNTSKVKYMDNIFNGCNSLEILDISSFDTSSVIFINNMFQDCYSLKSLDLTHFDTSKANNMAGMFLNCYSLTSLELGNFKTSLVTDMSNMFNNCKSLISLNLNSFNTENVNAYDNIFFNLTNTLKYCINEEIKKEIKNQFFSNDKANCYELCDFNSKYIYEKNKCINNCYNDDIFIFEYNKICHDFIPLGYYLKDEDNKTLGKCNNKCSHCSIENDLNGLCISCNNNEGYFQKFNDSDNNNLFVNCYNIDQIEIGYYLDYEEKIFNLCHSNCKNCTGKGNIENFHCTECYSNNILINNNCYNKLDIPDIYTTYIYSYKTMNSTELKDIYTNITFLNFMENDLDSLYKIFNLDKETDKLYILITDYKSKEPQKATSDYNFKFLLENETELNLSIINEDLYIDFYVPIKDLNLANFNYSKYFSNQGYDIYNKSSEFYTEFCTPAFQGENDITLKDRRKYIYPNNVTLCEENCEYNGIDIENERIICSCNLNQNKSYEDSNVENDFLIDDDGNFFSYFLDKINYKVFKCHNLLSSFSNLKKNYAFYTILGVFILIIILNFIFCFYSLPKLKEIMNNETPTKERVKKEIIEELKKYNNSKENKINNPNIKNQNIKKKNIKKKIRFLSQNNINSNEIKFYNKKKKNKKNKDILKTNNYNMSDKLMPKKKFLKNEENYKENINKEINNENKKIEDINELPFTLAIKYDKRNILQIFYSIITQKLELINLFYEEKKFKIILINEYILSLLFNSFFNALLYSDDIVSNKYHNNGELDIFVTLILSIISNIITSIICFYVKYSKGIEERYELIMEIKIEKYFLINIKIFFRKLKLRMILFFISEIILISCCFYYIVIFCIVYSKSRGSLMVNYLTSLLEGLIISIAITIIILVTRKIGLACSNRYFYNISKYINNKF